jgi:hypothetical protein
MDNKLKTLAKLIWSDIWGLVITIIALIEINLLLPGETQLKGFITGIACGSIVWFMLSKNKHWSLPVANMVILFAHLITKRAVDVGIAGFYLNDWYSSTEIMLIISTIIAIILYKVIHKILQTKKSEVLIKVLCLVLALTILFFAGAYGAKVREKEVLFSNASNMMMRQLFIMRDNINRILELDYINLEAIENKLDFNFANTTVLIETFYPTNSSARRFDDYLRTEVKNFIFTYDEGVQQGKYAPGKSNEERLQIVSDFCGKLAGDINAARGEYGKSEGIYAKIPGEFSAIVK